MKKYIFIAIFSILAISPVAYADTTLQNISDTQTAYQQALVQLISLLQAQVTSLLEQLKAVQTTQSTLTTQVTQIAQNSVPMQTLGSVEVPLVDKSEVKVTQSDGNPDATLRFRPVFLTVTVINSLGNPSVGTVVTLGSNQKITNINGQAIFIFNPISAGISTLDFIANNIHKSVTVTTIEDPIITDYYNRYSITVTQINDLLTKLADVPNQVNTEYIGTGATTDGIAPIIKARQADITKQITDLQKLQGQIIAELKTKYN